MVCAPKLALASVALSAIGWFVLTHLHARLTVAFIALGVRCGLSAAAKHLVRTFETTSPGRA